MKIPKRLLIKFKKKMKQILKPSRKFTKLEREKLLQDGLKNIYKLSANLRKHTQRNENTNHINYKIHHLLHEPFIFVNAYSKISKNKGALTEGFNDDGSMKFFGLKKAIDISQKIKNETYRFKPVKRNWVPKPGKTTKRPVDVPTQSDRIVQEAIRGILEAIYEPEFKLWDTQSKGLSSNYGFRPSKSTWSALEKIKKHSQGCTMVIEGDIVSAYNHVDHDILLNILKQRIKDKKFINLMQGLLKSGIMDANVYEHSLKGTPQGGIVSPLLFNIYLFGFDKFIHNEIIQPLLNEEKERTIAGTAYKNKTYSTKTYRSLRTKAETALKKYQKAKTNKLPKETIKTLLKDYKKYRSIRNKTPYADPSKIKRKIVYVRYADDWILAFSGTKDDAESYKNKISKFLLDQLKMQLDNDKTKITRISKGYTFLGFEIRMLTEKPKQAFILQKNQGPNKDKTNRVLKRTTSRMITIEPDSNRILTRLQRNQFCDKNYQAQAKPGWLQYEDFQIVEKYSQVFRGIYNYYLPCQRLTRLNRISYILQYSCARTIARRRDISMSQVFQKYGKNLRVSINIKTTTSEKKRTVEFLTLTDLRKLKQDIITADEYTDPFKIRQYWRTKMKFYQECCICGETQDIALHHLNSVKNLQKHKNKHQIIRSTLNRIQIPVCEKCHKDITYGRFNDPKRPVEFYNEFIAKL